MEQKSKQIFDKAGLLRCPVCSKAFFRNRNSLRCERGHNFDISSRGSINLQLNQKPTKYTKAFYESRQNVFRDGFYTGVAEMLSDAIKTQKYGMLPQYVLDAGCGEGGYVKYFAECFSDIVLYAMDIEKEAIRMAARRNKGANYIVADVANIPLASQSMDAILNVFSPSNYGEFARVLKPNGFLLKVVPGDGHMREIRALLGKETDGSVKQEKVVRLFDRHFQLINITSYCATFPVEEDQREDILQMSPLLFHKSISEKQLRTLSSITIDAKLLIGLREKRGINKKCFPEESTQGI